MDNINKKPILKMTIFVWLTIIL